MVVSIISYFLLLLQLIMHLSVACTFPILCFIVY
jgi:hypothetical protein